MSKPKSPDAVKDFEVIESNADNVVFRIVIKTKGRTPKEIKKIRDSLPKATLHYFSDEDYAHLKEVEAKILLELASFRSRNKRYMEKITRYLLRFLEI